MLNSLRTEIAFPPARRAKAVPQQRGPHGKFLRKLPVTPEGELCWLIWSRKWGMWHRRGAEGGANGYTKEIADAGLFPYSKATAYHDGESNEAFHVSEKVDLIDHRLEEVRRLLGNLQLKSDAAKAVFP